jgi:hypothetical protein
MGQGLTTDRRSMLPRLAIDDGCCSAFPTVCVSSAWEPGNSNYPPLLRVGTNSRGHADHKPRQGAAKHGRGSPRRPLQE